MIDIYIVPSLNSSIMNDFMLVYLWDWGFFFLDLFISQDLKKLSETHLYSPLSPPNPIFSTRQKTQFEQKQEHQNKSETEF